jgi:hypothetical protein
MNPAECARQLEPPLMGWSLREIIAWLEAAIAGDKREVVKSALAEIGDHVDRVADSGDVRAIARERDRMDRIARALQRTAGDDPAAAYALGYLADVDRRLDRTRTQTLGARAAERHEQETAGVREQVLTLLSAPRRPGDLAKTLGCDPSQISRALRELRATGAVVEVSPPDGYAGDRRAHWFARSQTQISGPAAA